MTLARINAKLAAVNVELVKGAGYHYYVFDDGQHFASESVMVCYTNHVAPARWIADGLAFGEREKLVAAERAAELVRTGPLVLAGGR